MINEVFYAPDAVAILSMPRPRVAREDFWAWAWEKSSLFTVRSAYREVVERKFKEEMVQGSSTGRAEMWKTLWKLKVLPKIRVFWWWVVTNMLPCLHELKRRHIMEVACCPLCGYDQEDLFHSLLQCDHARRF